VGSNETVGDNVLGVTEGNSELAELDASEGEELIDGLDEGL